MTHVMYRFVKRVTLLVGVLGALLLGLALPASATTAAGTLSPGNTMCTDQTGSAGGATLSGTVTTPSIAGVTWTVRAAKRPGFTERTVFTAHTTDVTGAKVPATNTGVLFYRLCLANDTSRPIRFTGAHVLAAGPAAVSTTGPTTALLSNGGAVCGERIARSGHLQASSSAPVTWIVRAFSAGPSPATTRLLTATTSSVNASFGPGRFAFLDGCAIDRAPSTTARRTAISMQFTAA